MPHLWGQPHSWHTSAAAVFDQIDWVIKPIWHEQSPATITAKGFDVERQTGFCDEAGPADGSNRTVVVAGIVGGGVSGGAGVGGCQQACTGVTPCQALLGPHQQKCWLSGHALKQRRAPGEPSPPQHQLSGSLVTIKPIWSGPQRCLVSLH